MSQRLPLRRSHFATIASAYAPSTAGYDEAKTKFYEDMHALLSSGLNSDKLTVVYRPRRGRPPCLEMSAGSPWNWRLQPYPSAENLRKTSPSPDQHLLPPADAKNATWMHPRSRR
nr:unnamed protein product [Spirometra erinaceieuropaei]